MSVELALSEVDEKLSETMKKYEHIVVVGDDGRHLLDVYDHYDIESVYSTLEIVSDTMLMSEVKTGIRQYESGEVVSIDPTELFEIS